MLEAVPRGLGLMSCPTPTNTGLEPTKSPSRPVDLRCGRGGVGYAVAGPNSTPSGPPKGTRKARRVESAGPFACRNSSRSVASPSDGVPRCAPSSGASRFGQHSAPLKARWIGHRAFCLSDLCHQIELAHPPVCCCLVGDEALLPLVTGPAAIYQR